jgi:hypothetical protein
MVNSVTNQRLCEDYLTEEDLAETEEYFQPIITAATIKKTETHPSIEPQSVSGKIREKTNLRQRFDSYLQEAIDEALSSLGEVVKNATLEHLTNDFGICKDEIPEKIYDFARIIQKMFGLGAGRLEVRILRNLESKIKMDSELAQYELPPTVWTCDDGSLVEYVKNWQTATNFQIDTLNGR